MDTKYVNNIYSIQGVRKCYREYHEKILFFHSLIYPGYCKQSHVGIKTKYEFSMQRTYDFQIKMELFTQCPHSEIYRVIKIVHISTEKVTNKVINQHCLPFNCMKVNILGKCIIKIPNLQQVMVLYRVCQLIS